MIIPRKALEDYFTGNRAIWQELSRITSICPQTDVRITCSLFVLLNLTVYLLRFGRTKNMVTESGPLPCHLHLLVRISNTHRFTELTQGLKRKQTQNQ